MSRYAHMFASRRGVFVPFLMLGDPDLETSELLCEAALRGGADALELGIPFSDPIADGPVIQAAAVRARLAGATPARCFDLTRRLRARFGDVPLGLLVYANLVVRRGIDAFYTQAQEAGVDSVLVADVPTLEGAPFAAAAKACGIDPIFIVPPDAEPAVLRRVAAMSAGYTYVLGRAGVTGEGTEPEFPPPAVFASLREHGAPPALVGFGISRPEHVRAAVAAGAAGAISGSALVARIARAPDRGAKFAAAEEFVRAMRAPLE